MTIDKIKMMLEYDLNEAKHIGDPERVEMIEKYCIPMLNIYEQFLTDNLVAILTDMKDELKHCEITGLWKANYREGFNDGVSKSLDAIQQKIDKLKENMG